MSLQGYWADQTADVFRELPEDLIAVLTIGAIEQHGPHLPLSVDRDLVEVTVTRTLPLLDTNQNVLVLPLQCRSNLQLVSYVSSIRSTRTDRKNLIRFCQKDIQLLYCLYSFVLMMMQ